MLKNNQSFHDNASFILSFHNIEDLKIEDIQYLLLFEFQEREKQRKIRVAFAFTDFQPTNLRVVGLIAFAALGFFLLPGLIGVSPLMGLLIGGAIGWRALGFSNQNRQQPRVLQQERVVSSPGFDSSPQPLVIGGTIPMTFTNKSLNPNGGVRLNGNSINAYIRTFKNEQILYQLTCLGLGEIEEINLNNLKIDNQPLDNFFDGEITSNYVKGTDKQSRFSNFPFYSQVISPTNNKNLGLSFRALANTNSLNNNSFAVDSNDFDAFSPSETYRVNAVEFRVVNKSSNGFRLFLNKNLSSLGDRRVNAVYAAKYETSKRCTRLDLNFAFDIWARDNQNNLIRSAVAFDIYLNGILVACFYVTNAKEGTIRRAITFKNLPLNKHKIETYSHTAIPSGVTPIKLIDSGVLTTVSSGKFFDGKECLIDVESGSLDAISSINDWLRTDNKAQNSSDRGANGAITSINEIVFPEDINQGGMTDYGNLVIIENVAKASNRLQNAPAYSHEITKGIKGRNHILAGESGLNSNLNSLVITGFNLDKVSIGYKLRNIDRKVESTISQITLNTLVTQDSLSWQAGDRFLVYFEGALNYFPDVLVYMLTSPKGGMGKQISENFINYPSICESRNFCATNNFYFDDVLENSVSIDEWISQESLASLLYPSKYAGIYGLKPETYTPPTDIFNVSRIVPGTFSQSRPNNPKVNGCQLTYKANIDGVKFDKTVTVVTSDVWFGREILEPITLKFESITNEDQARKVAARNLKSRLIQDKVVSFQTGIAGFNVNEGDLIIVQYALTERDLEVSGFCLQAFNYNQGSQEIKLSKPVSSILQGQNYKASIYHLESGLVEENKNFQVLPNGNLLISGLQEVIKPARSEYNADIVIITSNLKDKLFRVVSLKPNDYFVTVDCVNWSEDILEDDDLFFIT